MNIIKKISAAWINFVALFILSFFSVQAYAQDKKVDVDLNVNKDGGSNWYAQPWVWVVGAAVFIIIIVAILRGGGNRD